MAMGDLADVEYVVRAIATTAIDNEKYFGELDAVVGDGDFGYSMARGFEAVLAEWDGFDRTDVGTFLKKVAVVITRTIGGTSGPIWGTAFLRAGATAGQRTTLAGADVVAMLRAAIEGIKARGSAELGDKTLLDALIPATDALERDLQEDTAGRATPASSGEVVRRFAEAARASAEATRPLRARRGRASYTGERSIGTLDAGAVAVAVMAERIARHWTDRADQADWTDQADRAEGAEGTEGVDHRPGG